MFAVYRYTDKHRHTQTYTDTDTLITIICTQFGDKVTTLLGDDSRELFTLVMKYVSPKKRD